MYDDRCFCFAHWAAGPKKGVDQLGPTAAQIGAFLYNLFDTQGLLLQTIKGYRSCLASVLSRMGKVVAVQANTISDMITSLNYKGLELHLSNPIKLDVFRCVPCDAERQWIAF